MEVLHAIRVGTTGKNLDEKKEVNKAIDKLKRYELDFVIPNNLIMADSFSYFMERNLDPYDAVAISVALHEKVDIFITRDRKLKDKTTDLIKTEEPENIEA